MKLYLSSTFIDLKRHREKLALALRKSGYEVVRMEEYAARNQKVEFACVGDVVACDIYVGVFAWRYGYIPKESNPEELSVTEMEYLAAEAKKIPRLTFLLEEKTNWSIEKKDDDLTRIKDLRSRLKEQCSGYFSTADELCIEVLAALRVHESTHRSEQLEAINTIVEAQDLGPSYMMNIKDKLGILNEVPFIEIQLGPTAWWNTRLYLVSALAKEIGETQGIVFVKESGEFLLMTSPTELCLRMEKEWPMLEKAYSLFRGGVDRIEQMEDELWRYPLVYTEALESDEQLLKYDIQEKDLLAELGIARNAEIVDIENKNQRFLQQEILGRQTPFVALVRDNKLEGLVNKNELALCIAKTAFI
jgi:hypothetical protein